MTRKLLLALSVGLLALSASAADWSQFRGDAAGVADKLDPPTAWPAEGKVTWKAAIPGAGWAQPVLSGDTVFVLTAVSDPPLVPKDMKGGIAGMGKGKGAAKVTINWQLLAVGLGKGDVKWAKSVAKGSPKYGIHPSNTYATETPATDGKRVYAFVGATGTVAAFDFAGKELWKTELGVGPTSNDFGTSASPVVHDGKLYVQVFNEESAKLVCLNPEDGKPVWEVKRDKPGTTWATPLVWVNSKRAEIVVSGQKLVTSHDPKTGAELWRVGGVDSTFSSTPAATADLVFFGTSGPTSAAPLYAVKAGASGDCTLAAGATSNEGVAWFKKGAGPGMASPVATGGLLYVPTRGGLACYEAATGKEVYKESLPGARQIAASPVAANGKLVLLDEAGFLYAVKLGREFELIEKTQREDLFWATPTPTGTGLLVRGVAGLYFIGK